MVVAAIIGYFCTEGEGLEGGGGEVVVRWLPEVLVVVGVRGSREIDRCDVVAAVRDGWVFLSRNGGGFGGWGR